MEPSDPSQSKRIKLSIVHYACYLLCGLILIAAYVVLGTLFWGVYELEWWSAHIDPASEKLFLAFIWGALGGTSCVSIYFTKEANAHRESRGAAYLPNILEPLGYILFIVGSGFTGVILLSLIHAGFIAAYQDGSLADISDPALFVLSFIGGFSADRVRAFCLSLGRDLMREVVLPSERSKES